MVKAAWLKQLLCCCLVFLAQRVLSLAISSNIEKKTSSVTVSGLSGGAYFAVQFHVANSQLISGAGILAGGPYFCSEGSLLIAEGRCMRLPQDIPVNRLIHFTEQTHKTTHTIDAPSHLMDDRIWLLSSTSDTVVAVGVVEALREYYSYFLRDADSQIRAVFNQSGEHAFLTLTEGSECLYKGDPYINACNYDAAGAMLQHLYEDSLTPPAIDAPADGLEKGELIHFPQADFLEVGWTLYEAALGELGYVYIPMSCANGSIPSCQLHISFHGCKQTIHDIGEQYMLNTGIGRWAGENNLVVLFPQARRTALNPKGCWDWWGYTGIDYASQLGIQMATVKRMAMSFKMPDEIADLYNKNKNIMHSPANSDSI